MEQQQFNRWVIVDSLKTLGLGVALLAAAVTAFWLFVG